MTAASDLGLTLLSDIDHALVLGVASYQPLIDLRTELRGGDGVGLDPVTGRVPHIVTTSAGGQGQDAETEIYEILDTDLPANFIAHSDIESTETNGIRYTVSYVSILPSWTVEKKLADAYLQRYADALLQAIMRGKNLSCNTIPDYLSQSADGAGAAVRFRIIQMVIGGDEIQPRIHTRVQFLVPASVLANTPQGVVEG